MLIDSHCHLDQLDNPRAALLEAAAQGIDQVVAVSEDPESMRAVLALKRAHGDSVRAGLGLHPAWIVGRADAEIQAGLAVLAAHLAEADTLGEVGLDYKWAETPDEKQLQERVLEQQLALAAENGKPINLHSRRCPRQVMDLAVDYHRRTGLNAQLHWFTHSRKLVRICNQEGIFVSVGPTVLHDPQAQDVALTIADELILLESDAPVPVGGVPGHPARVRPVAEKLAALTGKTWEQVAALTGVNFRRYLGDGARRQAQA